jgi:hypothetical protein
VPHNGSSDPLFRPDYDDYDVRVFCAVRAVAVSAVASAVRAVSDPPVVSNHTRHSSHLRNRPGINWHFRMH